MYRDVRFRLNLRFVRTDVVFCLARDMTLLFNQSRLGPSSMNLNCLITELHICYIRFYCWEETRTLRDLIIRLYDLNNILQASFCSEDKKCYTSEY